MFDVVAGLVNDHPLQVHHVRNDLGAPMAWDLGFLAVSALLALIGAVLVRRGSGRREKVSAEPDAVPA